MSELIGYLQLFSSRMICHPQFCRWIRHCRMKRYYSNQQSSISVISWPIKGSWYSFHWQQWQIITKTITNNNNTMAVTTMIAVAVAITSLTQTTEMIQIKLIYVFEQGVTSTLLLSRCLRVCSTGPENLKMATVRNYFRVSKLNGFHRTLVSFTGNWSGL